MMHGQYGKSLFPHGGGRRRDCAAGFGVRLRGRAAFAPHLLRRPVVRNAGPICADIDKVGNKAAQARVQEGYIQPGDPSFAAWMAYGDPASKSIQTMTNGTFEIWNYVRVVPEYYEEWIYDDMPPPRHHHRPPPDPRFGPPPPPPPHYGWRREERVRYVDALKRQLLFSDGLCVGVFEY